MTIKPAARTLSLVPMRILVGLAFMLITSATLADEEAPPTLDTPSGIIVGFYQKSQHGRIFKSFEGIPYARPPVGELRFQPPQLFGSWEGKLHATKPGPMCQQYQIMYDDPAERVTGEEDCLYLNVYAPVVREALTRSRVLLPVIFFIHGGSFQYGSGHEQGQPLYVMNKNIVLVTINYRLGPLGFLSTEDDVVPGNMGLKDQALALRWVSKNIESFGGDPNSVTLFGQSAGAASVHYHYLSPMSRGLFHRGVSLSGTALNCWSQTGASQDKAKKLGAMMGCPTSRNEELVRCLQSRPAKSIMAADSEFMGWLYNPDVPFGPVVEKNSASSFINKSAIEIISSGEAANVPWITTVVSEEGLYTAGEFIADEERLKELDENWEAIAPHLLDYNYTIPGSDHTSVAGKIRKHYLGGNRINRQTTKKLIHMMSDRLYSVEAEKSARIQARANSSPVRFYYFSYRGENSLTDEFTGTKKNFGVSHADDEFYVFTVPGGRLASKNDLQMSEYLVNLWTSFATTGIPDAGITWLPVDPSKEALHYLHIAGPNKVWMESDDNFGDKKFWGSIDFDENRLAHNCDSANYVGFYF